MAFLSVNDSEMNRTRIERTNERCRQLSNSIRNGTKRNVSAHFKRLLVTFSNCLNHFLRWHLWITWFFNSPSFTLFFKDKKHTESNGLARKKKEMMVTTSTEKATTAFLPHLKIDGRVFEFSTQNTWKATWMAQTVANLYKLNFCSSEFRVLHCCSYRSDFILPICFLSHSVDPY